MEYSKPYVVAFRGSVLAQAENVEITYTSNDNPVRTLSLGLAGFSDGAEECSLRFRSAVPLRGMENDYADFCMKHRTIQFTIREADAISTFEGRFMTVGSSSAVNSPNGQDVAFMGKMLSRLRLSA